LSSRSQRRNSTRTFASSAPNGSSRRQELRLDRQRARQGNALALTARHMSRKAVGEIFELYQLQ